MEGNFLGAKGPGTDDKVSLYVIIFILKFHQGFIDKVKDPMIQNLLGHMSPRTADTSLPACPTCF